MTNQIAHAALDHDGHWREPHLLAEHLMEVEKLVISFLFGDSKAWGALAGRWHDLGKYQQQFQSYIRDKSGFERENAHLENAEKQGLHRVTHSTAGAVHAVKKIGAGYGHLLAYLIAGHHAGLPDWSGGKGALGYRLEEDGVEEYQNCLDELIPETILDGDLPGLPVAASDPKSCALWLRIIFSALVDADFLDTEAYMQPEQAEKRIGSIDINSLQSRFFKYMKALQANGVKSELNKIRSDIYNSCLQAAKTPSGIFSLTVPTGGGKTLSSLGFALEHARLHGKYRIIYAIPFTSIIEQNADVFREALGRDAVLEHHSNLDIPQEKENSRNRLACENWDAPLIVTTNVQLFESLHASRTSRCRRLHNLQNSVIVLDEAQQIPRDFHAPIVRCMKKLSEHFGVTWVLCTATQPDFSTQHEVISNKTLLEGFEKVTEICPEPATLARQLKRVEVELPEADEVTTWEQLAEQVCQEDCVLAIVGTRKQARELFSLLPDDGNSLHLSAQMCAEHRTEILSQIRLRLKNKREELDQRPLRVVSTQLVEAGVDVDFPVVFRAMAGLDSIAQSAGRCNREGKLNGSGRVVIFNPPQLPPAGFLRQAQQVTMEMLKTEQLQEPLSPSAFQQFFQLLNRAGSRDKHGINELLTPKQDRSTGAVKLQFREAANKFRMINNAGVAVVVPFIPEAHEQSPVYEWLALLESEPLQKWVYRKLQRYTINLPESFVMKLQQAGALYQRAGLWLVEECHYDKRFGVIPPEALLSAEASVL